MAEVPHRGAPTIKKSGFFAGGDWRSERNCTLVFIIRGLVFRASCRERKTCHDPTSDGWRAKYPASSEATTSKSGKYPVFECRRATKDFRNGVPFRPDLLSKYAAKQSGFAGANPIKHRGHGLYPSGFLWPARANLINLGADPS